MSEIEKLNMIAEWQEQYKQLYEKVLFEGTEKECYAFVEKELENV